MLFALIMQFAIDGQDPFKLAAETIPTVQKGDDRNIQNYKFRHQVLVTLMDPYYQRLLRSMLHVFRNIRMHHSEYTKVAKSPSACLDFYHMWSSPARWAAEMIVPIHG